MGRFILSESIAQHKHACLGLYLHGSGAHRRRLCFRSPSWAFWASSWSSSRSSPRCCAPQTAASWWCSETPCASACSSSQEGPPPLDDFIRTQDGPENLIRLQQKFRKGGFFNLTYNKIQ